MKFFKSFFEWFKKNTKNKIIAFSVIFIFALGYSFLHRPLGLIMWYQWSYLKEYEQMETKLYQVQSNKKEFLKLYHNFYEKENIDKKSKKIEQELLKYIDDFEIDLLTSSFIGLSDLYLESFVAKLNIYVNDLEWKMAYSIFEHYRLTKEQSQSYYNFLKNYNKFLFFINRLDIDNAKQITAKLYGNLFIFRFMGHFLPLTKEKCFMKDDVLDMAQKSYVGLQQISNVKSDYIEKALDVAQYIYDEVIKKDFNECK